MPIYDYRCEKCGFTEMDRKEHPDMTWVSCPECDGLMKRLIPTSINVNMGAAGAHGYYDDGADLGHDRGRDRLQHG